MFAMNNPEWFPQVVSKVSKDRNHDNLQGYKRQ